MASFSRFTPAPSPCRASSSERNSVIGSGGQNPLCARPPPGRHGRWPRVEAVVDKDLTAALLARQLDADVLLLLTDVAAVQDGYGTPRARPIHRATRAELRARNFPSGLMGPKIEAVCRFVEATGKLAVI